MYICQLCRAGYPSKLVCLAHIQKVHPKVDPTRYASIVIVNDAAMRDGDPSISPIHSRGVWTTPIRTMAPIHLSPVSGATCPLPGKLPGSISPYSHHHGATYITTPPTVTLPVKAELEEEDANCQPLDFSMKTGMSPGGAASAQHSPAAPVGTDDQPIDLTIAAPHRNVSLPTAATTASLKQSMQPFDAKTTMLRSHLVSPVPLRLTSPFSLAAAAAASRGVSKPPLGGSLKLPLIITPANPPPSTSSSTSSPAASPQAALGVQRYKPEYQAYYNPTLGCLQCPHCSMLFKHGLKVQCSNNFSIV